MIGYIFYRLWFAIRHATSQSFRDYYRREREQAWDNAYGDHVGIAVRTLEKQADRG